MVPGMTVIALGADHAGFPLKEDLKSWLIARGHDVVDLGTQSSESVDYPDFAVGVGSAITAGKAERGVLVCGTGIGMAMAANKVPGIRAALCHDTYSAERAALSNNAQIITMGSRVIGPEVAKAIADSFLMNAFDENGRSAGNVKAINQVDAKYHR